MLTRRQTNGLLLASALAPSQALAQKKKKKGKKKKGKYERPPIGEPAGAAKLEDILNSYLGQGCKGKFTVPAFDVGSVQGDQVMQAVVRLDWPPGYRQRSFRTATPSSQDSFDELVRAVLETYQAAWPGCVRV